MTVSEDVKRLVGELKTQRDELAVKMHLARADARDEWAALERKWERLLGRAEVVGHEAGKAAGDVEAAARLVVEEIKKGYERIRRLL